MAAGISGLRSLLPPVAGLSRLVSVLALRSFPLACARRPKRDVRSLLFLDDDEAAAAAAAGRDWLVDPGGGGGGGELDDAEPEGGGGGGGAGELDMFLR